MVVAEAAAPPPPAAAGAPAAVLANAAAVPAVAAAQQASSAAGVAGVTVPGAALVTARAADHNPQQPKQLHAELLPLLLGATALPATAVVGTLAGSTQLEGPQEGTLLLQVLLEDPGRVQLRVADQAAHHKAAVLGGSCLGVRQVVRTALVGSLQHGHGAEKHRIAQVDKYM